MSIKNSALNAISDVKQYWNYPPKKKFISYKEMMAYSVGGIGVQFVLAMVSNIALSANSLLMGASIGIKNYDLQTMAVISTIIGFLITPIRAAIIDNTRSKLGKFRPYLLYTGFPTILLAFALVYLPYNGMSYFAKMACVLVIYNLLQLVQPFYTLAYTSLVQVMSPNSEERTWVMSISSVVYSIAPTVTGFVLPLIGGLDNLKTYKIAFPIFCTIGVLLGLLCVTGTKERIVVSKNYVPKVRFFDGLRDVAKNKYFWILNISNYVSFLNMGLTYLWPWVFYYGMNNNVKFAFLGTLMGTASLPGMLFAAPLLNKFGKRNIFLISNFVKMAAVAFLILFYQNYVISFVLLYIFNMAGAISIVATPAIQADIYDYQQYKTGNRLEGFIGQIGGLIGSVLGLATGYAIPMVQKHYGLTDNYNQLYDADFRGPVLVAMAVCGIIGTVLAMIPYFFYDLSPQKHREVIKVLKIRALFEDYMQGALSEEALVDSIEDIRNARKLLQESVAPSDKAKIAEIKSAKLMLDELNKFETEEMKANVEQARTILAMGPPDGLEEPNPMTLQKAVDLPENTKEEKKIRRTAIRAAEDEIHYFNHHAAEYIAAKKLLHNYDSYAKFEEIQEKYDEAKRIVEQREIKEKARREQEAIDKKERKLK